jgi:hypothetical protein
MLAVTSESQNAEIVRLLLAKGAKADVTASDGQSALSWAHKWGADTEISKLVAADGGHDGKSPDMAPGAAPEPSHRQAKEAAERAITLLQSSNATYSKRAGCAGCHHQLLSGLLLGAAGERGLSFDKVRAAEQVKGLQKAKLPSREAMLQRVAQGVSPIENSLVLVALGAQGYAADDLTDALYHDVAAMQRLDGSWSALNQRPPIVYGRFAATAYAVRALQLYASPGRKPEVSRRIARAREWLRSATPVHTEERAMQLLALRWSGADPEFIRTQAQALMASQQADGGWAQRESLPTDAYATGQALYALRVAAGDSTADPVFRRGVGYLVKTQHEDGSWHVRSRSVKFQPYFESGFPYADDQWISAAGTNWAALALTVSEDIPSISGYRLR